MEKLARYRAILRQVVEQAAEYPPSASAVEAVPACDEARDQYLLLHLGWNDLGRVHAVVCHLRLWEGKVWIERDGTPDGLATTLLAAGIPPEDVVLAFQPAWKRPYTAFAVA